MAENVKVLRRRLRSIRNTNKITRAMQMVSASKLRRAQQVLIEGRPYTNALREILDHMAASESKLNHPFFEKRPVENRLLIVITGDRGLAGAYNSVVIKRAMQFLAQSDVPTKLVCIGRKAFEHFRHLKYQIIHSETELNGTVLSSVTNPIADTIADEFIAGNIDEVLIAHNEFVSTVSYRTTISTLLPLSSDELIADKDKNAEPEKKSRYNKEYILEPTPEKVFENLIPRFLRNNLYMTLISHFTAEHSARMTAMNNATKNSEELINTVSLMMNKARQSAITTEITEVVGGAEALND